MARPELPIDRVLPAVVEAVMSSGHVVLRASTGAGKTTRVPGALLDAGLRGQVVMLEPRRVAARAAARRIAKERGSVLGAEVGYRIRFDTKAGPSTRLLVVTEGVLLRMLQADPFLESVGAVVFDEFHERSLFSDVGLALTQRVRQSVRDDLAIVVMSATLDPAPVAGFLGDAPVVESEGRAFPVDLEYVPVPDGTRLELAVRSALIDVATRTHGDILVFLPGVGEIRRTARAVEDAARAHALEVVELHGELSPERQDRALASGRGRRVLLATNVAESSITIPGVQVVIDSGLERLPRLDPAVGLERLETVRISLESADQRAGRAGRDAPGRAIRLWGRGAHARLDPHRAPAIRRTDVCAAVLQLRAWGETDLTTFPWFEPPPQRALADAEALLVRLGAVRAGRLTETGRTMAEIPAPPRLARMLVEARTLGHARRIALAAAVLSDRSPFARLARGATSAHHSTSDLLDVVEALEAYKATGRLDAGVRPLRRGPARQALRARDQLVRAIGRCPLGGDAHEAVLRAVNTAYADRLARRRKPGDTRAVMIGGRGVRLDDASAVREPELFVCVDLDAGRSGERAEAWVRVASGVERAWIPPEQIETRERVAFDPDREAVSGSRVTQVEDLVLDEVAIQVPRGPQVEEALVEAARQNLDRALPLEAADVVALRTRVACLAEWCPDLDLPDLGDDALRAMLPELARGKRSFAELRRTHLLDHLLGRFSWAQRQVLDREAPERIEVPSGSRIRLTYARGRPPVLAVRIQEVFGLLETPRVGRGRVKVLMHLLAPNNRPQQITDDMASFWSTGYAAVRAELRRRYPKHAWPENPLTARAERRPPRRKR